MPDAAGRNKTMKLLAASAGAGLVSGALVGLGYAVPAAAPVMLAGLLVAYPSAMKLTAGSLPPKLSFAFASSLAWMAFILWAHSFAKLDFPSLLIYGSLLCSILVLFWLYTAGAGGFSAVLLASLFAGGLDFVFNLLPVATSLSPAAQFWKYPHLIASLALFGTSGWVFLVALAAGSAALLLFPQKDEPGRLPLATLVLAAGLLAAGAFPSWPAGREIKVCSVQSGSYVPKLEKLEALTLQAAGEGAELVVWPEMTLLKSPAKDPATGAAVSRIARDAGVVLVAPFYDQLEINGLAVFGPEGALLGVSFKLNPAWAVGEESRSGDELSPHDTPLGRIGVCLCYDSYFPAIPRNLVAEGAEIVIVPALSMCPEGALRYAPLIAVPRALENRTPVVWSEPLASCLVVTAGGRITARSGDGPGLSVARVKTNPGGTLFTKTRGLIPVGFFVLAGAGAVALILRKRRRDRLDPGGSEPGSRETAKPEGEESP